MEVHAGQNLILINTFFIRKEPAFLKFKIVELYELSELLNNLKICLCYDKWIIKMKTLQLIFSYAEGGIFFNLNQRIGTKLKLSPK